MQISSSIRTLALMSLLPAAPIVRAAVIFDVSLDTTSLAGHEAEPFSAFFQLTDGSGTGDANNTVTISQFGFGPGGGPAGAPAVAGGGSGNLASSVTLTDSAFLNTFMQ